MTHGLATLAAALLLAGCAPQPAADPGPKHRWSNPDGQQVEQTIPAACERSEFPPPPVEPPPPPPEGAIPPGWHRAVYTLQVSSIKLDLDHLGDKIDLLYCIPVSIHVYATAAGIPGQVVEQDGSLHIMPWDGLRNTPWRSSVTVAWDPATTAPVMNFDLSARFEVGPGLARAPTPAEGAMVGLLCSIRQAGLTLAHQTSVDIFRPDRADPGLPGSVSGPFVRCRPPAFSATPMGGAS